MKNVQIADTFDRIANLLEFSAANPFRIRAYRNGARVIHDLPESVESILADPNRQLTEIGGIGKDLAEKTAQLVSEGRLPILEELLAQIPATVLDLLRIPKLGPKKSAILYRELNITTLAELRAACLSGEVQKLKGFAAKTEQAILEGMEIAEQAGRRIYWADADEQANRLLEHLQDCPGLMQIEMAGSYRRGRETVGDLDVLIVAENPDSAMDRLGELEDIQSIIGRGPTKMSIRLESGLQIDLRVVPEESFGAALLYFTGSKEHNVELRWLAKKQGLKVNEYGVYRDDEYLAGRTEQDVYAAIGLPWFPPELRQARQEFNWAAAGSLPDLIELADIRGDLHMHTTATDGKATIEKMIDAARALGLEYIAITDHSKRVSMARGLDAVRLRQQWSEIDVIRPTLEGFQVLKGIECDILEQGGMDLPDDVLAEADWVVASVHYGQNQSSEQITRRIIGAIENPYVSAIAHPTGRIINRRKPYEVDMDAVMRAANEHGKMLELNANPARLDLDDIACAAAKAHSIPIVINSDAHRTEGLLVMRHGILQARRGGLTKDDVANTRSWSDMMEMIGRS